MFTLNHIKKISVSLATLMMVLAPTSAIFAEEAVTNNTLLSQETQPLGNVTLQGTEWAQVGQQTVPIYMNGQIKVVLNGQFGDICTVHAIDQYNNRTYLGQLNNKESLITKLYGYYKIELNLISSNQSTGSTFYVIY